jgi:hypothetical protein
MTLTRKQKIKFSNLLSLTLMGIVLATSAVVILPSKAIASETMVTQTNSSQTNPDTPDTNQNLPIPGMNLFGPQAPDQTTTQNKNPDSSNKSEDSSARPQESQPAPPSQTIRTGQSLSISDYAMLILGLSSVLTFAFSGLGIKSRFGKTVPRESEASIE